MLLNASFSVSLSLCLSPSLSIYIEICLSMCLTRFLFCCPLLHFVYVTDIFVNMWTRTSVHSRMLYSLDGRFWMQRNCTQWIDVHMKFYRRILCQFGTLFYWDDVIFLMSGNFSSYGKFHQIVQTFVNAIEVCIGPVTSVQSRYMHWMFWIRFKVGQIFWNCIRVWETDNKTKISTTTEK